MKSRLESKLEFSTPRTLTTNQIDHNDVVGLIGPQHSFHDMVRSEHLSNNPYLYFSDFNAVFNALNNNQIQLAIVAVGNTIHGPVENNQHTISQYNYTMVESIDLPIELHLASASVMDLAEVDTIYAHPVARNECKKFIDELGKVQHVKSHSNAQAALDLLASNSVNSVAITNALCIRQNNLHVLRENIHTQEPNITTFQIIKK